MDLFRISVVLMVAMLLFFQSLIVVQFSVSLRLELFHVLSVEDRLEFGLDIFTHRRQKVIGFLSQLTNHLVELSLLGPRIELVGVDVVVNDR